MKMTIVGHPDAADAAECEISRRASSRLKKEGKNKK